ncbi:MAG TPA: phosphoenolpyruvate synthase [Gemmatimonadaceae bacterium]|nr:phosphoenolpyruvate synthase [Gemmatimonadaceae bacterium]
MSPDALTPTIKRPTSRDARPSRQPEPGDAARAPDDAADPATRTPVRLIRWFSDITKADTALVGGKGANLGEMTRAGFPVPPGFVVTVDAYRRFADATGVGDAIRRRLANLVVDDPEQLRLTSDDLQALVRRAAMPDDVRAQLMAAYERLSADGGVSEETVAVRSSGTVEDTAQFSFAGMFQSTLNVRGPDALVRAVKDCWASGFTARLLFYRVKQGLGGELEIAAVVQKMVASDRAGVVFTVNPASNDPNRLVIEGAWGLGEVVVLGEVTPDHFEVDKRTLAIVSRTVALKEFMLERDEQTGETVRRTLPPDKANAPVLSDEEVRAIAELARRDESHYGVPQDAEWAMERDRLYLVQTRPITTLVERAKAPPTAEPAAILLHGLGVGPGRAAGVVRVLASPDDSAALQPGEILVAKMTSPDWVPLMRRAAAVVTDAGGMTSHAAIVSRELGIPCVVGTRLATTVLRTGMRVTVNAKDGIILEGVEPVPVPNAGSAEPAAASRSAASPSPSTATRIYVNLGEPELAESVASRDVDGVGLLRAEFMLLSALGKTHPRVLLRDGRSDELVSRMAEALTRFASAFAPRPVVYRATDFRSNEFRGLTGGEEFEPSEENPMIGYRGCFRYTREPDLFALELRALKQVRARFPNLHLMIPFVRTGSEFRACKRVIDESGLTADPAFQLWVMAEVPSVVAWLEEYVRLGVTGVSIGSNDLTQLVLGVDRDSEVLAPLYDERDRAVTTAIAAIIAESKRLGVTCSICGQAPSVHPEYAEFLVRLGIDSISVNPDAIESTRRNVDAAERRIMLAAARAAVGDHGIESSTGGRANSDAQSSGSRLTNTTRDAIL